MHLTLYRKYRPSNFNEVAGEEDIIKTIKNSLRENRMAHAYLFAGPRGVGKTTTARLIAKGLNCLTKGITDDPCDACDNCLAVNEGSFVDMIEIDAASNRGIDEIRQLKDKINYRPVRGRKKVYIIDEAHMLTKEAFNALLKTLEEPPSHVLFILATTEPDKILPTIISRCQRYDFKPISFEDTRVRLLEIGKSEGIEVDDASLNLIYEKAGGSMRDAISIFEKLVSSCYGESITVGKTQRILGVIPEKQIMEFLKIIREGDSHRGIKFLDNLWNNSVNIESFFRDIAKMSKELMTKGELTPEEGMPIIGAVYDVITKFKYEEDKRLLGYVILHKLSEETILPKILYREQKANYIPEVRESDSKEVIEKVVPDSEIRVTIDDVKRSWNEAVKRAKNEKITIAALLAEAFPTKVLDGTLYVGFYPENRFSRDKMEEIQYSGIFLNSMRELTHPALKIEYEIVGEKSKKTEAGKSFSDKIIEFFDGELI
ncbi:DNA polymerase III subunit gamma/tau [uncultured Ilyobacter sp.]|uniref:DNA polymerase III subunit gamma/tau n=1 Tax=uncultured Ilyobacter sp. TaxID=544433 RepID=UPI0029C98916|nr:DNA polymerase III subunit gamma/tau [uncultured Ilyobacter sp.]